MRVRHATLRGKLLAVMLLSTLVAVVITLAATTAYELRDFHRSRVGEVEAQAELLVRSTAAALAFDDAGTAQENVDVLRFQPRVRAAAVYTARGTLFAGHRVDASVALPALPGAEGVSTVDGELVAVKRIVEGGQILGSVYLRVEYGLAARLLGYLGIALAVALLAMGAAWGVASWLRHIVLSPIQAVGAAAREVVQRADYSRRVERGGDDELGALVEAFNAMMEEVERRTLALQASNREKEQQVEERLRAQQEVMRLNAGLEQRVQERTAELERSNRELALATADAERANRAKSEFLSSMSHELRTPLNAILGFGQILATPEATSLPPERRQAFAGHIVSAGQHLLTLIDDILNLAQIEAGRLALTLEPVPLEPLLEQCRVMVDPLTQPRDVRLRIGAAADLVALADARRLKQVLLNLLSNAIKYNRQGGSVLVDCARPVGGWLRMSVQDTGPGLDAAQLQALFQPFNRLGQEHGGQQGTGIGLVVTRHLVELMGGRMDVSSIPGVGSVFWIDLPSAAVEPASAEPAAETAPTPPPATDAPLTVLCVDDNPASLELIQAVMQRRPDVRLLTATDGRAGVELARRHLPDLILMDNNMPVLSGSEAQALLREDPRTRTIPIIAITANAMPEAARQGLAAGFYRYLTKPVDFRALAEAVDSALAEIKPGRRP